MKNKITKILTAFILTAVVTAENVPTNMIHNDKVIMNVYADDKISDIVQTGDINSDGTIDIKDSAMIKRYLAGWEVSINELAADLNGDGEIDIKDSAMIKRYLAGWDVEFTEAEDTGNIIIKVNETNSYNSIISNEETMSVSGKIRGSEKIKELTAVFLDAEGNNQSVELATNDISNNHYNHIDWQTKELKLEVGSNILNIKATGEDGTEVDKEVIIYRNSSELELADNVVVFGVEYEDELNELKQMNDGIYDIAIDHIEEQTYHLVVSENNPLCKYIDSGKISEGDIIFIPNNNFFPTGMTFRYIRKELCAEDRSETDEGSDKKQIIYVEVPAINEMFEGDGCIASDSLDAEQPIAFVIGPDGMSLDIEGQNAAFMTDNSEQKVSGIGYENHHYMATSADIEFDTGKTAVTKKGFQFSTIKPKITTKGDISKGSVSIGLDGIILYDADGDSELDNKGKRKVTTDDRIVASGEISLDNIKPVFGVEWKALSLYPSQIISTIEYQETFSTKITLGNSITKGSLSEILKSYHLDYNNETRMLNNKIALSGVDMDGTLIFATIGYELGLNTPIKGINTIRGRSEIIPFDPIIMVTLYATLDGKVKINASLGFDYSRYVKKGVNIQKEGFKGAYGSCEENKATAKGCISGKVNGYQIDYYNIQAATKSKLDESPKFTTTVLASGEGEMKGEIGVGVGCMIDGIIPLFIRGGLQAKVESKMNGSLKLTFPLDKSDNYQKTDNIIELLGETLKQALRTEVNAHVLCSLDLVGHGNAKLKVSKVTKEDKSGNKSKDSKESLLELSYDKDLFKVNIAEWGITSLKIKGKIVDGNTGENITGANVTLTKNDTKGVGNIYNKETTTDEEGLYEFENCTEGTYTIVVEKEGYETYTDNEFVISKQDEADFFEDIEMKKIKLRTYINAYADLLTELKEKNPNIRFELGYIDDDELPELFIFYGEVHGSAVHVYSYYDGSVVEIGSYGQSGGFSYSYRNNMIESYKYINGGYISQKYYKLSLGKEILLAQFFVDTGASSYPTLKITYEYNNNIVTEEEYDKAIAGFDSNTYPYIKADYGEAFEVNETNINRLCRSPYDFVNRNEK